ncbi:MAG: 3'-5' exonuclease [Chitinophagaceae bacterium]
MTDFLLFIDTESSGLPQKWDLPFGQTDGWPYVVQVAWLVYNQDGTKIKEENHYIRNTDYTIEPSSREIHHISDETLQEKGENRQLVLERLQNDLDQYNPIIVGHCVELDYKLLNVEYRRIGQPLSPLENRTLFCTMLSSTSLPHIDANKQMKLVELYHYLFAEEQPFPHDALYDAQATARCFFKEKEILSLSPCQISEQQPVKSSRYEHNTKRLGIVIVVAVVVLIVVVYYCAFSKK